MRPGTEPSNGYEFWIDRGGTFTDVVARDDSGALTATKVLSEAPGQYPDAAIEGIRRLLGLAEGEPLPLERIRGVKMGTTVATNALLERRGEPTLLVITRGFADQLRIGYQNRPKLFAKQIVLPELVYARVLEADERVSAQGEILTPLDEAALARSLSDAHAAGLRAAAIVFVHAYRFPEHERRARALAVAAGFTQVSVSHQVSPLMKLVSRGDTTVVDAYLSPVLRRYVDQVESRLSERVPLFFMKSNGGLTRASTFQGKDSILSGPAGGIVGMVQTSLALGHERVIGFDMGGTSTDVSHFAGKRVADCERVFDALVAGVRLCAPMLAIHTIAAGGGSILHFDGQRCRVGPDSAGADPGPACYRRGGPLTVTDCNVLLGKIQPAFFPRVFGALADQPLDLEVVRERFTTLAQEMTTTPEAAAEGFLAIAVANMANAIRFISVQRGHDVTGHTLCCFGGAGGQHACLVADELGIERVTLHPLAGVLSALGMGLAEIVAERQLAVERPLAPESLAAVVESRRELERSALAEVTEQGVPPERIELVCEAHLKYDGTDTALAVPFTTEPKMRSAFETEYRRRFAFTMPDRGLVIEALSVRAIGRGATPALPGGPTSAAHAAPSATVPAYFESRWEDTPVFERGALAIGQVVSGPAILAEPHATTVLEPGWQARALADRTLLLERTRPKARAFAAGTRADPVELELFNNLFMSIAEQMGQVLANTAYSVNIKERLDFSCALFDAEGNLVANAPHMPVHLGSMSESIRTVIRRNAGNLRPGDVYALNDPYHGGTHLPDVTVVMPVFLEDGPPLFVAARGHHADIGGITPGSMPPGSRNIGEEGVLIDNFKLVEAGRLRSEELRALLASARYPARNPEQNLADLRAQIAACEKGRSELLDVVRKLGSGRLLSYMEFVRDNAEESVRRAITGLHEGSFETELDSGAKIGVRVTIDRAARQADVDFGGTSAELPDNFNAPPAVVHAAVLYVFRTLVDDEIPMNAGCFAPITLRIPEGSLLAPRYPAATVAGNVETSQAITDALYGALGVMAASQGTMNNFTFGDATRQYYETIAGGSGAGPGFDGTASVQTHMTNSRLTDPEVLEHRFPVLVEAHSIRRGSGGNGRFRGGDGAVRRIRFLEPMTASILAGRRRVPPYGMAGGEPGALGRTWV
ncbi:MAG: hydantoinase B/oxoprolinase family protein, partial [Myxococcota bacterium]|nr:hydantoinase B/oxoprolinase family protein [Myxococcota bacterium]